MYVYDDKFYMSLVVRIKRMSVVVESFTLHRTYYVISFSSLVSPKEMTTAATPTFADLVHHQHRAADANEKENVLYVQGFCLKDSLKRRKEDY